MYQLIHYCIIRAIGGFPMKTIRINISFPAHLKAKLDALRQQGTTASGFIRSLVEREFQQRATAKKGR
jgi:metal-responsive CopG/Arc/MetJ family transcriptional regulator